MKKTNGFTLIELAIVLFILGLFSVGGLRILETMVANHQLSSMRESVEIIRSGVAWNAVKNRTCPLSPNPCNATQYTYTLPSPVVTQTSCVVTADCPFGTKDVVTMPSLANMGFPREVYSDPWGQSFRFTAVNALIDQATPFGATAFTVTSSGPDAIFGTPDDFVTNVSVGELKSMFIRQP